jgi:hypothetical protein
MKMRQETKDALYMLLDLLDSMEKTSNNNSLLNLNSVKIKNVKEDIFKYLNEEINKDYTTKRDTKSELIGILPSVLIDEKRFPTNEALAKFSENSLNFKIPFWKKRGRTEIVGRIIDNINKRNDNELVEITNIWKKFIDDPEYVRQKNFVEKKDFVDIWLDFFNSYRGRP